MENKLVLVEIERNEKVEFLHYTNPKSWTIEKVDFFDFNGQVSNLVTPNTKLFSIQISFRLYKPKFFDSIAILPFL